MTDAERIAELETERALLRAQLAARKPPPRRVPRPNKHRSGLTPLRATNSPDRLSPYGRRG
jgi:hypothetical protein